MIENQFPSVIDASLCVEFLSCEHKAMRKYVQGLRPMEESPDLLVGKAFARAVEETRRTRDVAWGAVALEVDLKEYVPSEGSGKTLDRMQQALALYFETWPLVGDRIAVDARTGKEMVEWTFQVPIPFTNPQTGRQLVYAGAMDRVTLEEASAFDEDSGMWHVPGDDKTASSFAFGWTEKWDMSWQMAGYVWALNQLGMRSQQAKVRGVTIPSGRKNKSGGYGEPAPMEVKEIVVRVPTWRQEKWEKDMHGVVERMLDAWAQGRWVRQWGNSCNEYRGCEFKQVCMSPESVEEQMLKQQFQVARWSPLDRDNESKERGTNT